MLLQTDYRTILMFNGTKPTPYGKREAAGTAIVEFQRCILTKLGSTNDGALP